MTPRTPDPALAGLRVALRLAQKERLRMRASWVVPIGEVAVIDRHVAAIKAEIARRTRGRA